MGEWRELTLGHTGAVITGKTPSKDNPEDWGTEMPFVTPSDYGSYRKKAYSATRKLSASGINRLRGKILPKGSVMVTCIGSDMGKVAMNALPVITNQQINSIVPDEDVVTPDFLYYQLVSMYETLRTYGGDGTAVPIVNKGDFSNIKSTFPDLPEQKAIAEVLSSLDDKIDLLHRQNKTLEAVAETLFRHTFIDNAQDDWELGTLNDVLELHYGKALKDTERSGFGYPVVGSSGVVGYHSKFLVEGAGIVIGRKGTLGVVTYLENSFFPIDTTYYVKPKAGVGLSFAYFLLKTIDFKEMNSDSAVPGLNRDIAHGLEIAVPPIAKLFEFAQFADEVLNHITKNVKQIKGLEKLRDTLLPKLMSGDVRVECA